MNNHQINEFSTNITTINGDSKVLYNTETPLYNNTNGISKRNGSLPTITTLVAQNKCKSSIHNSYYRLQVFMK